MVVKIPNDNELVDRLYKGDIEAFDLIYAKYASRLYAFGKKYLGSDIEAEELVQTVFLKLWENHKKLKRELSFKSYLFTIAYNNICKIFRKKYYQEKFIESTLSDSLPYIEETEQSIDYNSVLEKVYQLIEQLPPRQKSVFLKSRNEGLSSKEIAQELGLSSGTVDNYISGALKFIRSRLDTESLPVLLLFSLFF